MLRSAGQFVFFQHPVKAVWVHTSGYVFEGEGIMLQDLRFGLRILRRNPAFSAAAIFIVALGIASTCVIFSFAEAAVFRALPYGHPSRLVRVSMTSLRAPEEGGQVSSAVLLNWREHARKIGQFAAHHWVNQTMAGAGEPAQLFGDSVSQGAFHVLGVHALIGRTFLPSDYKSGNPAVVVLSYPLWQSRFNGRRNVLGQSILLDGVSYAIVGVMPPGFLTIRMGLGVSAEYWVPVIFTAKEKSDANDRRWYAWGRLNSAIPIQEAQAALSVLTKQVMNPPGSKPTSEWRVDVTPMVHDVVKQWRSALILLLGAVAFLLAIACVNVANLLLARGSSRQREIAVRVAVGANRRRVIRQLLTESAILGGFGGGLGILLAHWGVGLEGQFLPAWFHNANFEQMGIDSTVLILTLLVSVAVGIIFGLAPALHASSINLVESLKESGASATSNRGHLRTQSVFVVAEVALSLILLIGAGLLLRSFLKLQGVRLGFNPNEVLTMRVLLPKYQYPKKSQQIMAYQKLLERIKALPGVQSSAFVVPLALGGVVYAIATPMQPGMANSDHSGNMYAAFHAVSAGYFKTIGIPLLEGREFTSRDTQKSEPVAIVDEAFARRYWPGQNPIGKEIFWNYPESGPALRVVGLVGSVRDNSLWGPADAVLYRPYSQYMFAAFAGTLVAKTRTPSSTAVAMQKAIHSVDPGAPVSQIRSMDQVVAGKRAENRFYLILVGVFALLALVLAAAGIASTVSYAVSQRRHEIGIRMALGAERGSILRMMMSQILKLALIGIAVGIGASLVLTRFVSSQLHGVTATDPLTFAAVSLLLLAVCLLASFVPAIHATSINPADTLRYL
jgi:predicted permease